MRRSTLLLFALAVLIIATGCTSEKLSGVASSESASLLSAISFNSADTTAYRQRVLFPRTAAASDLLAGDVRGDSQAELILLWPNRVDLLGLEGEIIVSEPASEGSSYHRGLLSDGDEDGKSEIIVGGRRSDTMTLHVLDGGGRAIRVVKRDQGFHTDTVPWFADGRVVYFTSTSYLQVEPRMFGAVDYLADTDLWLRREQILPVELSPGLDGAIAVSTRAVSRDVVDERVEMIDDPQNEILVVSAEGRTLLRKPFGSDVREGMFRDQHSGMKTRLIDLDGDGEAHIFAVLECATDLYAGASELLVLDLQGNVVSRREGRASSRASLGFHRSTDHTTIVVVWESTGTIELLDHRLETVTQVQLPYGPHRATIRWIGDLDGDRELEYIVSDQHRIYVLDQELGVEFSSAVDGPIRDLVVTPDRAGLARIYVLAGDLVEFAPGNEPRGTVEVYGEPAGMAISIDGLEIDYSHLPVLSDIDPGTHTFRARLREAIVERKLNVEAGRLSLIRFSVDERIASRSEPVAAVSIDTFRRSGEALLPEGFVLDAIGDVVPGGNAEVVLSNRTSSEFAILTHEFEQLRRFDAYPPERSHQVLPDSAKPNEVVLCYVAGTDPYRVIRYSWDGELLADVGISYGLGTRFKVEVVSDSNIMTSAVTGWPLEPRGVYAVDSDLDRVVFVHPVAGFINRITPHENRYYLDYYTPANGHSVTYPDGTFDRDDELSIHAITDDGTRIEPTQAIDIEPRRGRIRFFRFDSNGDSVKDIFFAVARDPDYNPGPSDVYRLDASGAIELVREGYPNATSEIEVFDTVVGERLAIYWKQAGLLEIFGQGFEPLAQVTRESAPAFVRDFDGNGLFETFDLENGEVRINEIGSGREWLFGFDDGAVTRFKIDELTTNGKPELVFSTEKRLFRYAEYGSIDSK